jgi:Zn-dependent peptidase ImmA (M78 family)
VTAVVHPQLQVSSDRNLLLAHLLGHFLLHIQPALARGSELRQGFRELVMPCERLRGQGLASLTPEEQELEKAADDFACALLMPLGMVKRAHAKIGDSQRIASFFGVPQEVVQQRCLGLAPGAAAQQPPAAVPPGGGAAPTDQLASTDTHSQETQSPVAPKTTKNPSQPPADQDTQSAQALARGQRLLAGQRYRSQPQQRSVHDGQSAGDGADTQDSAKTSLRRIRELAKRLDSSVDLD